MHINVPYMHAHILTHACTLHKHTSHVHVHTHTHIHTHIHTTHTHIHRHKCMHAHTRVCTHAHMHTHVFAPMHACTHTHTRAPCIWDGNRQSIKLDMLIGSYLKYTVFARNGTQEVKIQVH